MNRDEEGSAAVSEFEPGEAFAHGLDAADPLRGFRSRFELPGDPAEGAERVYLLGNSLGPLPRATRAEIAAELDAWAARGGESYFEAPRQWYEADARYRTAMGGVVGARPHEVALMGGLTSNLHFLLASFFRPRGDRFRILVERPCFPSDRYVVQTQLEWHGIDPAEGVIEVGGGKTGESGEGGEGGLIEETEIERLLAERGETVALVFLGGVNFLTGQALDIERITRAAHAAGCLVGFDLAHSAGNVPLALHEADVDFAAWCTYKYLNSGPGAVAGMFVHERHARDPETFRLGGWWGNDPDTRFRMRRERDFVPRPDAAGWQLGCPPILAMAPLGPALAMFEEAGMPALRAKSERLTGYLEWLLTHAGIGGFGSGGSEQGGGAERLTPADPVRRGAQLSLRVPDAASVQAALAARGVDVDVREPDVVRLAPAPLFNTYHDVWRAAGHLADVL